MWRFGRACHSYACVISRAASLPPRYAVHRDPARKVGRLLAPDFDDSFAAAACYPAHPPPRSDAACRARSSSTPTPARTTPSRSSGAGLARRLDVLGIVAVAGNVGAAPERHERAEDGRTLRPHRRAGLCRLRPPDAPAAGHGRARPWRDRPRRARPARAQDPVLRPQHGVDFIIETLLAARTEARSRSCTLGPLTNVAMALVKRARTSRDRIAEIVMMGGAYFEVGNITPTAEFNIYVDPDAADVVMRSGIPITMLPLDVTHRAMSTPRAPRADPRDRQRRGRAVAADARLLRKRFDVEKYGSEGRAAARPLRHRLSAAAGTVPQGGKINVSIETASELTTRHDGRGLLADHGQHQPAERDPQSVPSDDDAFYRLLTERLGEASQGGATAAASGGIRARTPSLSGSLTPWCRVPRSPFRRNAALMRDTPFVVPAGGRVDRAGIGIPRDAASPPLNPARPFVCSAASRSSTIASATALKSMAAGGLAGSTSQAR